MGYNISKAIMSKWRVLLLCPTCSFKIQPWMNISYKVFCPQSCRAEASPAEFALQPSIVKGRPEPHECMISKHIENYCFAVLILPFPICFPNFPFIFWCILHFLLIITFYLFIACSSTVDSTCFCCAVTPQISNFFICFYKIWDCILISFLV